MNKFLLPSGLIAAGIFLIYRANEAIRIDESVRGIQAMYGSEITGSLSGNEGLMFYGGAALVLAGLVFLGVNLIKKN